MNETELSLVYVSPEGEFVCKYNDILYRIIGYNWDKEVYLAERKEANGKSNQA